MSQRDCTPVPSRLQEDAVSDLPLGGKIPILFLPKRLDEMSSLVNDGKIRESPLPFRIQIVSLKVLDEIV